MQAAIVFSDRSQHIISSDGVTIVVDPVTKRPLEVSLSADRLRIANYGRMFGTASPSEHVAFDAVMVALPPDRFVYKAAELGVRRVPELDQYVAGVPVWSLVDELSVHVRTSKYPETPAHHVFGGGELWEWRFTTTPDIPPFRRRQDADGAAKMQALNRLIPRPDDLLTDARLAAVLKAMTAAPPLSANKPRLPIKTLGGWLDPDTFHARWGSIPVSAISGPYHYGDVQSAGEGHTNAHYNVWAWALLNGLWNQSQAAMDMGVFGMWRKCCQGLYHVPTPRISAAWSSATWLEGIWRGEKSATGGVRGDGIGPAPSKQFDLELVVAHLLYDDVTIAEAFALRAARVLATPVTWWWDRSAGERMAARGLDSMFAFWCATDDPRYRGKAEAMFAHLFANQDPGAYVDAAGAFLTPRPPPRGPFWSSIYAKERNRVHPWEAGKLFAAMYRWLKVGVGENYRARVNTALAWYWGHGVRVRKAAPTTTVGGHPAVEVAYRYDVTTDEFNPPPNIGGPVHGMFWVPLVPKLLELFPDDVDKIAGLYETTLNGILRNWTDMVAQPTPPPYQFSPAPIGAAADKINAMAASMVWMV